MRAYLVSGAFRIHRADCRDCEKEARRSDSAGNAGEYASRAEVIADLWSDIIAENPELYGTPGGLASLEAETIFLPYTSGLPETSPAARPAEDGSQPGEPEELTAWAAGLGLEAADLGEVFERLLDFLNRLDIAHIYYTLIHTRPESMMVDIMLRGWRWEVEFTADGSVEIERYESVAGTESDLDLLKDLFADPILPSDQRQVRMFARVDLGSG